MTLNAPLPTRPAVAATSEDPRPVTNPFVRRPDRRSARHPEAAPDERRGSERRQRSLAATSPLFQGVDDALIDEALAACLVVEYTEDTVLLEPGQVNRHIYVLLAGGMTVDIGSADSPHVIRLQRGESAGEMSVGDGNVASARVSAEKGSRILVIDSDTFWNRVMRLPGVARNLMVIQSTRQRRSNAALIEKLRSEMKYEQIRRDLAMAAEIQLSMLPSNFPLYPDRTEFDVHASMVPAREVGGDFYDTFMVDPDHLFFIIGDVSGKGVAAALFMARAMTLIRSEASHRLRPDEILHRVNCQLAINNDRCMFVTVVCGLLEVRTGLLRYSNAGHCAPLIGGPGGFRYIEIPYGTALGLDETCTYATEETRLWPGEMLVLFTDGVTEAVDASETQFSEPRLVETLNATGSANARQTVTQLSRAIDEFTRGEPQFDDITIMAIKYRSAGTVATAWDCQWELGIFELDLQHRHLFSLLNQMAEIVQVENGRLPAGLIRDFQQYYGLHASTEARYLANLPAMASSAHQQAHHRFDDALRTLTAEYARTDVRARGPEIIAELRDLWIHHVVQQDSVLRRQREPGRPGAHP